METSSVNVQLLNAIGWTILFGSFYSLILLGIYSRKYPARRDQLTDRIEQRSWSNMETLWMMAGFAGLMVLLPFLYAIAGGTDSALAQLVIVLLYSVSQLVILIAIGRRRKRSWAQDFGMERRRLRVIPFALAIYLAMLPAFGLATMLYNNLLEHVFGVEVDMQGVAQLIAESHTWVRIGLILISTVAAPLYEELVFRGVLFPYLIRRIGFVPAVLMVSVLFGGMHFHLPTLFPLFLLSIVLCFAYWRTGTLWISIGLHALFNSVSIAVLLLTG